MTEADTCRSFILPKVKNAGWDDDHIREQKYITDGRIIKVGKKIIRGKRKRPDYILYREMGHPIAVVEAKADYIRASDGLQQVIEYAGMLDLKFAYASNGKEIIEHDFIIGKERNITDFPSPDELWRRLRAALNLSDSDAVIYTQADNVQENMESRYYQTTAVNRTLSAVLSGRKRILLTMATGTGKTYVAFQIIWRLWNKRWNTSEESRRPKILYLADRNVLVDSPKDRMFAPFGDARWKIQREANTSREMYFATYQSIAEDQTRPGLYKQYPRDFFDLVIVDECHRGSAKDDSNWREILEYFSPATQIGMTATPLREENKDTYLYFGNPVFTYSLAQGIKDGFLSPFEVYRVVADVDAFGWRPAPGEKDKHGADIPNKLYTTPDFGTKISHLPRTRAYATRLRDFMNEHGRFDKTIVFCADSEEAAIMRQELVNLNSDIVKDHPDYVVRIVSDEKDVGYSYLDRFMDVEGETPVIVTTSKLLSTGVDIPTCKNIVIFKTINSIVEFKQIIGRGTRVREDYGKLFFNILDFTGSAVTNFADPEFDGEPARLTKEEIDRHGNIVKKAVERDWESNEIPAEAEETVVIPGGYIAPDRVLEQRKFYVEDGRCEVIGEMVYSIDPKGQRISVMEYSEYVGKQIVTMYSSKNALRSKWSDLQQRELVVKLMNENGVDLDYLQELLRKEDTDPLDLVCHIAYNTRLVTRRERADRILKDGNRFFKEYQEKARKILNELLSKYVEYGIEEMTNPEVFNIAPLNEYGNILEVQQIFGGKEKMLAALGELQSLIYEEI